VVCSPLLGEIGETVSALAWLVRASRKRPD
jgi:hypothetical protein